MKCQLYVNASNRAEHDAWQRPGHKHNPSGQRGARQAIGVDGESDKKHPVADHGNQTSEPEESKIALTERSEHR